MKVYAVIDDMEDRNLAGLYLTRGLAEAAIGRERDRLRRAWRRLVDRAGRPIVRQGYKDGLGGIIPQRYEDLGDFEDFALRQGAPSIEEWEVIESLDPIQSPGQSRPGGDASPGGAS